MTVRRRLPLLADTILALIITRQTRQTMKLSTRIQFPFSKPATHCLVHFLFLLSSICVQSLLRVWTSTTCWSTISTMSKTSCSCMSCLLGSWFGTFPWMWAQWLDWAAKRNTRTSSTNSRLSRHLVILPFINHVLIVAMVLKMIIFSCYGSRNIDKH